MFSIRWATAISLYFQWFTEAAAQDRRTLSRADVAQAQLPHGSIAMQAPRIRSTVTVATVTVAGDHDRRVTGPPTYRNQMARRS